MRGVCSDDILAIEAKLCGRWILGDVLSVGLSYQNLLREWSASMGEYRNFQCQFFNRRSCQIKYFLLISELYRRRFTLFRVHVPS